MAATTDENEAFGPPQKHKQIFLHFPVRPSTDWPSLSATTRIAGQQVSPLFYFASVLAACRENTTRACTCTSYSIFRRLRFPFFSGYGVLCTPYSLSKYGLATPIRLCCLGSSLSHRPPPPRPPPGFSLIPTFPIWFGLQRLGLLRR